jgi:hypothetical protein
MYSETTTQKTDHWSARAAWNTKTCCDYSEMTRRTNQQSQCGKHTHFRISGVHELMENQIAPFSLTCNHWPHQYWKTRRKDGHLASSKYYDNVGVCGLCILLSSWCVIRTWIQKDWYDQQNNWWMYMYCLQRLLANSWFVIRIWIQNNWYDQQNNWWMYSCTFLFCLNIRIRIRKDW